MKFPLFFFLLLFCLIPQRILAQDSIQTNANYKAVQNIDSNDNNGIDILLSESAPVILFKDTLFSIKSSIGSNNAEFRAKKMSNRLSELTKHYDSDVDEIYSLKGNGFINIMYNDEVAFIMTHEDAVLSNLTLDNLANQQIAALTQSLAIKSPKLSLKQWLFRVGYFILSLAGLLLVLRAIRWIHGILNVHLSKFDKKFLKRNKNFLKYFIPKSTKNIFVFLLNMTRIVITIIFLLGYLPFMFSFFPWTEGIVSLFYDSVSTPIKFLFFGFIEFIPSLIFIVVIIYFTRYIIRVEQDIVDDIDKEKLVLKGFHKDWAKPTEKIIRIIIYSFALVMIFPHVPGSNSSAFKGVSIFIGAIISFGSTSAISNIIAGIVITYMRPFQIGDRIKVGEITGDVLEKTSLITRIRTLKNEEVNIPNANILSGNIINYSTNSHEMGLILHTTITLGYDVPWVQAEKLLLEAAGKSMLIQKMPKPFVLQTSLGDNYVSYELNAYTKNEKKMPLIYSDLHRNILDAFNKAGVEILSPQYVAARDGNLSTVPSQNDEKTKSPFETLVNHLTGKDQKVTYTNSDSKSTDI